MRTRTDHLQPGDLYLIEGHEIAKIIIHPVHENGAFSVSLDFGTRTEYRGYFPDERRSHLVIYGKKHTVLLWQPELEAVA